MAIINGDSSTVVVDAVLTKKGRELLAQGREHFNIIKYAFADDEVDYSLWDSSNENGTTYYGIKIENLPLMEASTNGTLSMRNKLITLNKDQTRVSVLTGLNSKMALKGGQTTVIEPGTNSDVDVQTGYTLTLFDSTAASIYASGVSGHEGVVSSPGVITSLTAIGKVFKIIAKNQALDKTTTIAVEGNESGATFIITLTVTALEILPDGTINTQNSIR